MNTQKHQVYDHLKTHGKITSIEAIRLYGITRLAQVIRYVKQMQLPVVSRLEHDPENRSRHWSVYEVETVKMP